VTGKAESQHELHITRTLDAPRDLVWQAWTDPEHLQHWMGPEGFTATHLQYDLRPGGSWRACLLRNKIGEGCGEEAGAELWQSGKYLEVVKPERLVFTFGWDGRPDLPRHDTVITLTFEERDGKTLMNFHQGFFATAEDRDGHRGGWNSSFGRLEHFVQEFTRQNF
jgi:uncharacterized protein YndB with AHSA1/START domain